MTSPISARIFVLGCPRSGTTLVQSFVGAHPRIRAFPESHFFPRAAGAPTEAAAAYLRAFLDAAGIATAVPEGLTPVQAFVAALDSAASADGADMWSEKTPAHLHHVDAITRGVPDARFVHVLRRGSDVVASLHRVTHEAPERWGGRPRSFGRCARRWCADVRISLRHHSDPAHHLVRYEALVERPERTVAELCRFLGLAPDPAMLERRVEIARAVTLPDETWKARTAGPLAAPSWTAVPPDVEEALAETQALLDEALPAGG